MVNYIWLGIYIIGLLVQWEDIYCEIKHLRYRKSVGVIWLLRMLLWPIIWLKNFIGYYLYESEDYRKR
jgi:hypothetical protein